MASAQVAVGPAIGGYFENTNMPGSDYRWFTLAPYAAAACQMVCNRDHQCAAWTFVQAGIQGPMARCYLKSAKPSPVSDRCCVSGFAAGFVEAGWNRPGADFLRIDMVSGNPTTCLDACRANPACRAFTLVNAGVQGPHPVCWLKNQVPDLVQDRNTTSGVVR